ncbi:MAG: GDP-mannose 4,6-dehydratase [Sphingomonadaceae bacterium]|nr:GDP-mannose 4,6-dehydratase [Sphingomonadaceae bacterium]
MSGTSKSWVLVTGAAGFIGFHLCRALLARGERVIGIDAVNDYYAVSLKRDRIAVLESLAGADEQFRFAELDFADEAALEMAVAAEDIDRIVHLGAQAGVRYSLQNPRAYARSNLLGHVNILEVARHRAVRHLVYASSSSVYGRSAALPFRVEDRVDYPISLYAATKRADELMSETYAHLYRLPQTGLRFFTVYGPWGRPDMAVWLFTQKILAGEPIPLFAGGELLRDFTYIDDIITGVVAALDNPPPDDGAVKAGGSVSPHRLYNIGNNKPERVNRLITLIEAATGREALIDHQPMQPGDVEATFADIGAIASDLGFAPATPLEQGISLWVDWYRGYIAR